MEKREKKGKKTVIFEGKFKGECKGACPLASISIPGFPQKIFRLN
jgi:hypothetical protein